MSPFEKKRVDGTVTGSEKAKNGYADVKMRDEGGPKGGFIGEKREGPRPQNEGFELVLYLSSRLVCGLASGDCEVLNPLSSSENLFSIIGLGTDFGGTGITVDLL